MASPAGNFTTTPPVSSSSSAPPTTTLPSSTTDDSTTSIPSTSSTPPTTSVTTPSPSTKIAVTTVSNTNPSDGGATTLIVTSTAVNTPTSSSSLSPTSAFASSSVASSSTTPSPSSTAAASSGGLHGTGRVVVAVVVPIVGVALIALFAILFWRRRQNGRIAEEARRKEVEEYGYNPNSDVGGGSGSGGAGSTNGDEMVENDGEGYRGWGSTNGGRKSAQLASSTGTAQPLSPGGMVYTDGGYSDGGYPHGGNGVSPSGSTFPAGTATSTDGDNSNSPLIQRPESGASVIGAMTGPPASENTAGGVHRGPSNASSNYSTMSHSDGSDGGMPPTQHDAQFYNGEGTYDNYSGNAYQQYGDHGNYAMAPPVIRDVQARRNTRIETPTNLHYPQQGNSGIAQNF